MNIELLAAAAIYAALVAAVAVAGSKTTIAQLRAAVVAKPTGFGVRWLVALLTGCAAAHVAGGNDQLEGFGTLSAETWQYLAILVGGIAGGYFPQTIQALRKLLIAVVEGGKGFVLGMLSRFKS